MRSNTFGSRLEFSNDLIILHCGDFDHHSHAAQARAMHNAGGENERAAIFEPHVLNGRVRVAAEFCFQRMFGEVDFQMMRMIMSVLRALFVGEAEGKGAYRFIGTSSGKFA